MPPSALAAVGRLCFCVEILASSLCLHGDVQTHTQTLSLCLDKCTQISAFIWTAFLKKVCFRQCIVPVLWIAKIKHKAPQIHGEAQIFPPLPLMKGHFCVLNRGRFFKKQVPIQHFPHWSLGSEGISALREQN